MGIRGTLRAPILLSAIVRVRLAGRDSWGGEHLYLLFLGFERFEAVVHTAVGSHGVGCICDVRKLENEIMLSGSEVVE